MACGFFSLSPLLGIWSESYTFGNHFHLSESWSRGTTETVLVRGRERWSQRALVTGNPTARERGIDRSEGTRRTQLHKTQGRGEFQEIGNVSVNSSEILSNIWVWWGGSQQGASTHIEARKQGTWEMSGRNGSRNENWRLFSQKLSSADACLGGRADAGQEENANNMKRGLLGGISVFCGFMVKMQIWGSW